LLIDARLPPPEFCVCGRRTPDFGQFRDTYFGGGGGGMTGS
jgi:hypothetical protein